MDSQKVGASGVYLRHFVSTLLVSLLISGTVLFLLAQKDINTHSESIKNSEVMRVKLASRGMSAELETLVTDLLILASHVELRHYLDVRTERTRKEFEAELLATASKSSKYDQLRLLDERGMEVVRVNASPKAAVVPLDKLQDKSDRYYFKESFPLSRDTIYISPLDLNVEHKQVELPFKPMIRLATPVYDSAGIKSGVLVLNYLAQNLIDLAAPLSSEALGQFMFVNRQGYWLLSPNKDDEWGFMFPNGQDKVFASRFPDAWGTITANDNGEAESDHGSFVFCTVGFDEHMPSVSIVGVKDRRWKIISYIPKQIMQATQMRRVEGYVSAFLVFSIVAVFIAATRANLQRVRYRAEYLLQQSEERYRGLVESSHDSIWETDASGVFTYVSPHAEKILAWPAAKILGKSIADFATPETAAQKRSEMHELYAARKQLCSWRIDVENALGEVVHLETNATPRFDAKGTFLGYRGMDRDISSRIKTQLELEEARNRAEHANHAKSDFLARMSHEIRTPMNAIIGMSHLALRTKLTDRQLDYLTKIETSAHSLLGIINDILDFSKIESGKLTIEKIPFDLEQVMDNLASMLSIQAASSGLEFLLSISPDVPTELQGDPLRLGQVLLNLAGNSIKFTEEGEVVVKAELAQSSGDNVGIHFTVSDSGIGMTREQKKTLFAAFSQADESTTRKYGGTGLGLAISKRLVELMGGDIVCTSVPGQGSTFEFTLPFGVPDSKRNTTPRANVDIADVNVLVVDDNETARHILREALQRFVRRIHESASCREALQALSDQAEAGTPVDIVFMDWKMPEANGLECTRRIHSTMPADIRPKIVMLTAYGREDIRREANEVGVDAFLLKPASNSLLYNAIVQLTYDGNAPSPRSEPDTPVAPPPQILSGARILVAEDNDINRQLARELLEDVGVEVTTACDGQEALDIASESSFDAILMDIEMPVMDGLQAAGDIRALETHETTPIIALTAHAMDRHRKQSLAAHMNDHLAKPFAPNDLYAMLARWIGGEAPMEPQETAVVSTEQPPPDLPPLPNAPQGLDVLGGLQRFRYKTAAYMRSLQSFRTQYATLREEFATCIATEATDTARQLTHALKGAAGTIGANSISAIAADMERLLADGRLPAKSDVDGLCETVEKLCADLADFQMPGHSDEGNSQQPLQDDLLRQMTHLIHLLEQSDISCRATYEALEQELTARYPEQAPSLRERFDVLDFPAASAILKSMLDSQNANENKDS